MMAERVRKIKMNYYGYICNKAHKLIQGFTISEEYNETLDSGTITISNVPQMEINPYDDVFIFGEWCGYYDVDEDQIMPFVGKKFNFKGYPIDETNYQANEMPCFYKHFLVDDFLETILILDDDDSKIRYQYKIDLFSETKGLEDVHAPNISITQPLDYKISTVGYCERFLNLYNKKIKKTIDSNISTINNNWEVVNKYSLATTNQVRYLFMYEKIKNTTTFNTSAPTIYFIKGLSGRISGNYTVLNDTVNYPVSEDELFVTFSGSVSITGSYDYIREVGIDYVQDNYLEIISEVFADSYTPDFTLNSPSLRQIFDKLLITKDRITVVKDDKIYALDITKRRGKFNLKKGEINYITGSKTSENYCTNLRRNYTDGLAQDNTGRYVEYLGFRNSDCALLTIDNMRIETGFPIYKINKIHMCYFKNITLNETYNGNTTHYKKIFLCKQNITPLIKLNSERNALSEDITEFVVHPPQTVEELAKYKLATLGYDIGSKYIEGWGTKFQYPDNFFWQNVVQTYLEAMFKFMNSKFKTGIYNIDFIIKKALNVDTIPSDKTYSLSMSGSDEITDSIVIKNYEDALNDIIADREGPFWIQLMNMMNGPLHLKHLFFEIEYTPFFSGAIIQSKGLGKDNITKNDNQSSSLSLLEFDGLAQKEKINRFGNKGIQINARYKNPDQIQKLGSVYEKNLDKDVVIYHKQYSINDNEISCVYYGAKDYVLKDYFTSVFARYRTYRLMSYGESIERAENKTTYVLLSKDKKFIDNNVDIVFSDFENTSFENELISFYRPTVTEIKNVGKIDYKDKLDYGFFSKHSVLSGENLYITDSNIFVSGTSLCLNMAMRDNISIGNYIEEMVNNYWQNEDDRYMVGATQDFASIVDDMKTGAISKLAFNFGHFNGADGNFINDDVVYDENSSNVDDIYAKLFALPRILPLDVPVIKNKIKYEYYIFKDNKERINMTLQFMPITDNEIYISQWFAKLSNLFGVYLKLTSNLSGLYTENEDIFSVNCLSYGQTVNNGGGFGGMVLIIDTQDQGWIDFTTGISSNYSAKASFNFKANGHDDGELVTGDIRIDKIVSFDSSTYNLTTIGEINISYKEDTSGGILPPETYQTSYYSNQAETFTFAPRTNEPLQLRRALLTHCGLNDDNRYMILYCLDFPEKSHFTNSTTPNSDDYETILIQEGLTNSPLTNSSHRFQKSPDNFVFSKPVEKIKNYYQNLFWFSTPENYDFKEHMIYDEFGDEIFDIFTELHLGTNELRVEWEEQEKKLYIWHRQITYGKHILCYYKTDNNKFNFVFGFKPSQSENNPQRTVTSTSIYVSLLSGTDLTVYDKKTNLPVGVVPNELD